MQRSLLLNSQGGVIKNVVSVKQLAELEFPLPELSVQQQIVDDFAEEDSMITTNQRVVQVYQQKIDQLLKEAWGD
jgi:hypothetical protein